MLLSENYEQDELDLIQAVGDLTAEEFLETYQGLEDELNTIADKRSDEFTSLEE